jgi:hypothetical protein
MRIFYIMFSVIPALLSGCAVITQYPTTIVSTAIWGTTGKSTTDHALSFVTGKDCVTMRVFSKYVNEYICEDLVEEPQVYKLRGLDKLALVPLQEKN